MIKIKSIIRKSDTAPFTSGKFLKSRTYYFECDKSIELPAEFIVTGYHLGEDSQQYKSGIFTGDKLSTELFDFLDKDLYFKFSTESEWQDISGPVKEFYIDYEDKPIICSSCSKSSNWIDYYYSDGGVRNMCPNCDCENTEFPEFEKLEDFFSKIKNH